MRGDSHCDTITEAITQKTGMRTNNLHIDWERLYSKAPYLQFMSVFLYPKYYSVISFSDYTSVLACLDREMALNSDICIKAETGDDITAAEKSGKVACLYALEGVDDIKGDADNINRFYDLGVRSIGLTWNHDNSLAGGIGNCCDKGLTDLGKKVIVRMNELGIITDVSHASERTFYDITEISSEPIIASHSNAKALCGHIRNLSDDQLKCICSSGGYVGLNAYPLFLTDSESAKIDDVVRHIEYMCALIGGDKVGLGMDFDGVDVLPEGISDVCDTDKIADRLASLNYPEKLINGIMGDNLVNLVKRVIS